MFEMPSTMVRKMMGPITIFTSFTNVSPTGRRARPRAGSSAPTRAPSATAHKTWNVRLRARRFIRKNHEYRAAARRLQRSPAFTDLGRESPMKQEQLTELLYQALETEKGGIQVYKTAIRCAQNSDLKEEWQEYLEQTENHERILTDVCTAFGLDPGKETPGRKVVRHIGQSLVKAMEMALQ